ncbi:MAG: hypothetical protein ACRBK7_10415 [Acidimicrobiales bacterium]
MAKPDEKNILKWWMEHEGRRLPSYPDPYIGHEALHTLINEHYYGKDSKETLVAKQSIRDHAKYPSQSVTRGKWTWLVVVAVLFRMTEAEATELFEQKGVPNVAGLRGALQSQKDHEKIWSQWPPAPHEDERPLDSTRPYGTVADSARAFDRSTVATPPASAIGPVGLSGGELVPLSGSAGQPGEDHRPPPATDDTVPEDSESPDAEHGQTEKPLEPIVHSSHVHNDSGGGPMASHGGTATTNHVSGVAVAVVAVIAIVVLGVVALALTGAIGSTQGTEANGESDSNSSSTAANKAAAPTTVTRVTSSDLSTTTAPAVASTSSSTADDILSGEPIPLTGREVGPACLIELDVMPFGPSYDVLDGAADCQKLRIQNQYQGYTETELGPWQDSILECWAGPPMVNLWLRFRVPDSSETGWLGLTPTDTAKFSRFREELNGADYELLSQPDHESEAVGVYDYNELAGRVDQLRVDIPAEPDPNWGNSDGRYHLGGCSQEQPPDGSRGLHLFWLDP